MLALKSNRSTKRVFAKYQSVAFGFQMKKLEVMIESESEKFFHLEHCGYTIEH